MNAVRAYVTIPLWRSPKFWGIRDSYEYSYEIGNGAKGLIK